MKMLLTQKNFAKLKFGIMLHNQTQIRSKWHFPWRKYKSIQYY